MGRQLEKDVESMEDLLKVAEIKEGLYLMRE
jgi:hypothetical protein